MTTRAIPLFTAVIAAYEIEDYAEDLFRSLELQTLDTDRLEIIFIDDGSRDGTFSLARRWAASSRFEVKVRTQSNTGVAGARNHGMDLARGQWIAFVDSDDVLDRGYFANLARFIDRDTNCSASMLTSRTLIFNEAKGTVQDSHPLGWKYRKGDRLVSLNREPHVIHLGGHSTIVRAAVVREHSLRFSPLVKPAFEDAHFIGRYLALFPEPVLGLVASARYYYRKRANKTSLIDTTWSRTEKFTHEPRFGHLDLLRTLRQQRGDVPRWAQYTVLYSLYWYFRADRNLNSPLRAVSDENLAHLWDSLDEIFEYIDSDAIREFPVVSYGWGLREGILRRFKGESVVMADGPVAYRWKADDVHRGTQKIGYTYLGGPAAERVLVDGVEVHHAIAKSVRHVSFSRTLMFERVLVVPVGQSVRLWLNGREANIAAPPGEPRRPAFQGNPPHLQLALGTYRPSSSELVRSARRTTGVGKPVAVIRALASKINEEAWLSGQGRLDSTSRIMRRAAARLTAVAKRRLQRRFDLRTKLAATSPENRKTFADAWIIMDHPMRADDNGEHFYRYVASRASDINAYFMLKRESPSWPRLQTEGFRLLAYGEPESIAATLNARFIIGSHIDAGVYDPVSRQRFGPSPARRVFLQHGMIMNDLSTWLNTKGLALMICSSPKEYEHFVCDGAKYKFTRKEVALTGLPRHDALVERVLRHPVRSRPYITIAPTWRQSLTRELDEVSDLLERRRILLDSEFYKHWLDVVSNESLHALVSDHGVELVFVMHDHLARFTSELDFPGNVRVVTYHEQPVQELLAQTRLLITDYSSIATEAAVAGAPVAYYHFDHVQMFGGEHTFSRGWFDYALDGFGPVHESPASLIRWVKERADAEWDTEPVYRRRLLDTLPYLDGGSCGRALEAIRNLDRPVAWGSNSQL